MSDRRLCVHVWRYRTLNLCDMCWRWEAEASEKRAEDAVAESPDHVAPAQPRDWEKDFEESFGARRDTWGTPEAEEYIKSLRPDHVAPAPEAKRYKDDGRCEQAGHFYYVVNRTCIYCDAPAWPREAAPQAQEEK